MRRTPALILALGAVLAATSASAQFDVAAAPPFTLSVASRESGVLPHTNLLKLTLLLDVREKYKVYRDMSLSMPAGSPASIQRFVIPPGKRVEDPLVPEGKTVLMGRNFLVAFFHLRPGARDKYTLRPVVGLQACSDSICYRPETRTILMEIERRDGRLRLTGAKVVGEVEVVGGVEAEAPDELSRLAARLKAGGDFGRFPEGQGYAWMLPAAFGWGLLVSLTPCVWPLIPITIAVVGAGARGSGWKRGLALSAAYVFGMSLTYAVLGALVGLLGQGVQTLARSPWLIGAVCLVFVALALSMFGLYEIRLPAALSGRLATKRGTGFAAVVVTGVLSGVVASPCVSAPLLGLFAGVAALGSVWVGMLAGLAFAWGMGAILIIAGTSSKALQSLPRAGEWMVAVQRFFGWVLLGVAVYFSHMVIGTAAYRVLMGLLIASAVVFLGVARPPRSESAWRGRFLRGVVIVLLLVGLVYVTSGSARTGIQWISLPDVGLARARALGRPAVIDFTAEWCTYCHRMDREVFADESVAAESRRFVMIRADVTVGSPKVDALYEAYGVFGPPAYVFIRSNGEHSTVNGKVDLETFLKLMRATR